MIRMNPAHDTKTPAGCWTPLEKDIDEFRAREGLPYQCAHQLEFAYEVTAQAAKYKCIFCKEIVWR
jgi:hypothetical protein